MTKPRQRTTVLESRVGARLYICYISRRPYWLDWYFEFQACRFRCFKESFLARRIISGNYIYCPKLKCSQYICWEVDKDLLTPSVAFADVLGVKDGRSNPKTQ